MCYRLWSAEDHHQLLPCSPPEILTADLAQLALTLASWGSLADVAGLPWLDQPDPQAMQEARLLLRDLAAVDDKGKLTDTGAVDVAAADSAAWSPVLITGLLFLVESGLAHV